MPKFALLAFDLDDTLVDTFTASVPNCVMMVNKEYGIPIQVSDWTKPGGYRGKAGQPLLDAIHADYGGTPIPLLDFLQKRKAYLHELLKMGLPPAPGMPQAIAHLHQLGRTLAVCTNSVPERAKLSLANVVTPEGINIPNIFGQHVYSAQPDGEPMNPKPHPYVYQHAAKVMGIDPTQCLATEDTPTGVQAAIAAGYTCIGYVGLHDDPDYAEQTLLKAGAVAVIRHWDEYLPLLAKLEA